MEDTLAKEIIDLKSQLDKGLEGNETDLRQTVKLCVHQLRLLIDLIYIRDGRLRRSVLNDRAKLG